MEIKTSNKPAEEGRKLSELHVENPVQKPMEKRSQSVRGLRDSKGTTENGILAGI
jgi:hypothetical protein